MIYAIGSMHSLVIRNSLGLAENYQEAKRLEPDRGGLNISTSSTV
jgi:hypothetical protein